jgi:hypothetical protein
VTFWGQPHRFVQVKVARILFELQEARAASVSSSLHLRYNGVYVRGNRLDEQAEPSSGPLLSTYLSAGAVPLS